MINIQKIDETFKQELNDVIELINSEKEPCDDMVLDKLINLVEMRKKRNRLVETQNTMKQFVFILSKFDCDKNCPFCTAKITKWEKKKDVLIIPETSQLEDLYFKYVILSGNGEPSFYSINELNQIKQSLQTITTVGYNRFQTSGNIFFEKNKWELFKDDFFFEVARTHFDNSKDMQLLNYSKDYTQTETFKDSAIWLNYICLNDLTIENLKKDIDDYLTTMPNIQIINIKLLNTNTLSKKDENNKYTQWILDNAYHSSKSDKLFELIKTVFGEPIEYDEIVDEYKWEYKNTPLVFYSKKEKQYGTNVSTNRLHSVVYYGGDVLDYQLNKIGEHNE